MADSALRTTDSKTTPATCWKLKTKSVDLRSGPIWMGILNVTPDSFSDGGTHSQVDAAIEHAMQLIHDGAGIIDIGGESTRPYSQPVSTEEELNRVLPVIQAIASRSDAIMSIDTSKAEVARQAIEAGAEIINDVTGLTGDPDMIIVAQESSAGLCVMHMQGNPQTMQNNPSYENVVEDIFGYLQQRRDNLLQQQIELQKICLDPGVGFGKTHQHNLELLANIDRFHDLGCPILVGHSRKGFIAHQLQDKECERDSATAGVSIHLAAKGIQIIRVHNVGVNRRAWSLYHSATNGAPRSGNQPASAEPIK